MTYEHILNTVTIQQMQVFLCAAETLNFTQTAQILHMTQPGVSKSIAALESTLCFPLFERIGKSVQLTDEGTFLYQKWNQSLCEIQSSYRDAVAIKEHSVMTIRIGVTNTTDHNRYFWPLIDKFRKIHPEISIIVESEDMKSLEYNLFDRNYDLIFVPDFEQYNLDRNMDWKYSAKSNIQIIVRSDSLLSTKKELEMSDILDKPVIILDPSVNPAFLRSLKKLYRAYNHEPNCVGYYRSNFQVRYAQLHEDCIHVTDDFWAYTPDEISRKIPLKNHYNGMICVWNRPVQKKSLKYFLDMIK